MNTQQVYDLVNSVNEQAFGNETINVTDTSGLISLGNQVLSSSVMTDSFLNTLALRIGRTILRFREYRNKLGDMVLNDFEYGAILQKIKVSMPEAEADQSYDLSQGGSVDMYKVNKLPVDQKLFVTRTPYQYHITIPTVAFKEAFLSPEAMGSFIGVMYGEVRNAIEVGLENLARVTLSTAACSIVSYPVQNQLVNLSNEYANITGTTVTADDAYLNEGFLRYAIMRMNTVLDAIEDMGNFYNNGSLNTFTPRGDARLRILAPFARALETQVEYAAFHDRFVKPDIDGFTKLNFWQAQEAPMQAMSASLITGDETRVDGLLAILHDKDAMGIYKYEEYISTTPENSAGLYRNQYYHEKQLRFIDFSENIVVFKI